MTAGSRKSIYLVLGCTVSAAAAQILMKAGAGRALPPIAPADPGTWVPFLIGLISNAPLFFGYAVNGITAILMILALRDGELSMLYPIIALTYVWVNIASIYFFDEKMNFWKAVGILMVIGGVAWMGRAAETGRKSPERQNLEPQG